MKITYIQNTPNYTGIGRYAHDIFDMFAENGQIIQFVFDSRFVDDSQIVKKYYGYNFKVKQLSVINRIFASFVFRDAIKYITQSSTLIHITSPLFPIKLFQRYNYIITIHDLIPFKPIEDYPAIQNFHNKLNLERYIRNSKNILTVSKFVKNDIISHFNINEEKLTTIYPPVSKYFYKINNITKENLRKELGLPLDKTLILSNSSLEARKNTNTIKLVMQKLGKDFKLIRIGESLGDDISFKKIPNSTVNKIYNACDVLFFPTLEEGFGSPVVEAFKTGLPVVASTIEVMKEIAGESAKLVDPLNIEDNIEAIFDVLDKKNYYANLGFHKAECYSIIRTKKLLQSYYSSIN